MFQHQEISGETSELLVLFFLPFNRKIASSWKKGQEVVALFQKLTMIEDCFFFKTPSLVFFLPL